jgi:hypothetical protein
MSSFRGKAIVVPPRSNDLSDPEPKSPIASTWGCFFGVESEKLDFWAFRATPPS